MKKLLAMILCLAMFIIPMATVSVSAAEQEEDNLLTDLKWTEEHKWTWDGDTFNAETGAVKDVVTGDWAQLSGAITAGSYSVADGILTTNGNATWTLPETIAYDSARNDYLRIEWKGTFVDSNTGTGIHRVLHGKFDSLDTLVAVSNYGPIGDRVAGTWVIQMGNNYQWVALADQENFVGKLHTITIIYAKGTQHLYVDGALVASKVMGVINTTLDDWKFSHLMGYQANGAAGAFEGTMDYVSISTGSCNHEASADWEITTGGKHYKVCTKCGETLNDTGAECVADTETIIGAAKQHYNPCKDCGAPVSGVVAHDLTKACEDCGYTPAPSAADAYASDAWEVKHFWDFNGNVEDSVGGVTATLAPNNVAPTYQDGKAIVNGNTAYIFDKPIDLGNFKDKLIGIRVDVKCDFDWETAAPKAQMHRVLGAPSGKNGAVLFSTAAAATYGAGCGITLCNNSVALESQVFNGIDKTGEGKFDKTAENVYTIIYYPDHIYLLINGTLIDEKTATPDGQFTFHELLGCSYAAAASSFGSFDYIKISTIDAKAPVADDNTGDDDNADTGVTLVVLPVALVAAAGVAVSRKRRNSK